MKGQCQDCIFQYQPAGPRIHHTSCRELAMGMMATTVMQ
jgi:hypothetical protein